MLLCALTITITGIKMTATKIITRKYAIENGLSTYFTGRPCINNHISKRGVLGGNCYQCDYERGKERREQIKAIRLSKKDLAGAL